MFIRVLCSVDQLITVKMGRCKDLTATEKQIIVTRLKSGMSTLQISKMLKRDHRTVKKAADNILYKRKRNKGKGFKDISDRDVRQLKRTMVNHPLLTSGQLLSMAGIDNIKRDKRCRILKQMGSIKKSNRRPPLTQTHKDKRKAWARDNMKTDFSKVVFTDESRVTLDGPDGWSKGWVLQDREAPVSKRRQQGGGSIMIWAGIYGDKLIGPYKVDDGVKLTSQSYCQFLDKTFFKWYKSQSRSFKTKCVFMHDNAPSHAANATRQFLERKGISGKKLMMWPPASPDLNPIENLWAIVKKKIYVGGRQYENKVDLWDAIQAACKDVDCTDIENLTNSLDKRVMLVFEKKGGHIGM